MTEAVWTGVVAGAAVTVTYVGLRRWMRRMARRADATPRALRLTIGGMVVRMGVVLSLAVLLLAMAPVHDAAFGATLAGGLVLSLAVELLRGTHVPGASPDRPSDVSSE